MDSVEQLAQTGSDDDMIHFVKTYNHRTRPIEGDLIDVAVNHGFIKFLDFLLEEGEVLEQKHIHGVVCRKLCWNRPRTRMLNHLVKNLGLKVNGLFGGKSYVGHAASEGNVAVTRALLKLGVDVNLVDTHGRTPLLCCALVAPLAKVHATMKVLLEHGADERLTDRKGDTAKDMLQEHYVNNSWMLYDNRDYTPVARNRYMANARALLERVDRWRFKQAVFSVVSKAFLDVRRKCDDKTKNKGTKSRTKSRVKTKKPKTKSKPKTSSETFLETFLEVNSDILCAVYSYL